MTSVPFRQDGDRIVLPLFGDHDTPWLAALLDELAQAVGQPWREWHARVDRLPLRVSAARRALALEALRGLLGGRQPGPVSAQRIRRELLGPPAVDGATRARRIATVASALGVSAEEVAGAMWADLPGERAVVLAAGRPSEHSIAAAANQRLIQRALMRCSALRLEVTGHARGLVRTAAVRGLLAHAEAAGDGYALEISGPLALFHRTTVYGRALGSLVPHLAWCEQFVLEARCDLGSGPATLRLQPPILLPPAPAPARHDSALEARFEREMSRRAPRWRVLREPAAVDAGAHLIFPDFQLEHRDTPDRRWWVEIVGYWTAEYLAHKLARYRAARLANVILCIDAERDLAEHGLPPDARIVRFRRRVPVDAVMAIIDGGPAG